ncbi:reverse transcriptase domain-containing protein [Tanacetum coccineum]
MVKKHDNSWRMCVDFKDLNKACPKDGYPLPEIDWKVESLCGFPFKCFLDAYKGYHQIQMAKEDEEKKAFITNQGIFCYTKMPFGLWNAATYQRLVDKAFHKQIGRNLKCTKKSNFHWTTEAEEAFKQMKQLIAELLMLVAPMEKEELIVYLAAAKETVSTVLMTEREAKQMPIYFVSRALKGLEVNYTYMGKLVLALVHASKRLKRYFREHPIIVITDQPIQQILADFIVERPEEESPDTLMGEEEELPEPWILFTDGSSCTDGSGAGLILTNPEGMEFTYALRFRFDATNNEAEYEALIAGLKIAEQMGVKNLQANVDSRLVANQVNGTYVAKENDMVRYLEKEKLISTVEVLAVVEEEGDTWMTPIFKYLMDGTLPAEVIKSKSSKTQVVADCQVHKPVPRSPQQKLSPITSSWPFYKWGIDIVGPFPEGPGKVKFLIVAIDYFTKCGITSFVDLDSQEKSSRIMENNSKTIRSRTGARNYMEELPHVLWAHRTMIKSSNGDTPFSLTYGTEAVIPAEIGMPTLRTAKVDLVQNDEALEINLDLLEERREQAAIREAKSKAKMERYYNSKVRSISFKPGDLVYRDNDASRVEDTGKLGPKWEGPYEVTEALGKGAYKLRDRDGKQLPRTWNISNLKKCYVHQM